MKPASTESLGLAFLLVATAATFLMFYQWGFPYDKIKHQSQAPSWLTPTLSVLGYLYLHDVDNSAPTLDL